MLYSQSVPLLSEYLLFNASTQDWNKATANHQKNRNSIVQDYIFDYWLVIVTNNDYNK